MMARGELKKYINIHDFMQKGGFNGNRGNEPGSATAPCTVFGFHQNTNCLTGCDVAERHDHCNGL